jgi:hypothetical protein
MFLQKQQGFSWFTAARIEDRVNPDRRDHSLLSQSHCLRQF